MFSRVRYVLAVCSECDYGFMSVTPEWLSVLSHMALQSESNISLLRKGSIHT